MKESYLPAVQIDHRFSVARRPSNQKFEATWMSMIFFIYYICDYISNQDLALQPALQKLEIIVENLRVLNLITWLVPYSQSNWSIDYALVISSTMSNNPIRLD